MGMETLRYPIQQFMESHEKEFHAIDGFVIVDGET